MEQRTQTRQAIHGLINRGAEFTITPAAKVNLVAEAGLFGCTTQLLLFIVGGLLILSGLLNANGGSQLFWGWQSWAVTLLGKPSDQGKKMIAHRRESQYRTRGCSRTDNISQRCKSRISVWDRGPTGCSARQLSRRTKAFFRHYAYGFCRLCIDEGVLDLGEQIEALQPGPDARHVALARGHAAPCAIVPAQLERLAQRIGCLRALGTSERARALDVLLQHIKRGLVQRCAWRRCASAASSLASAASILRSSASGAVQWLYRSPGARSASKRLILWWWRVDLNHLPWGYESHALTR